MHVSAGPGQFLFLTLNRLQRGQFGEVGNDQVTVSRRLIQCGTGHVQRIHPRAPFAPGLLHCRRITAAIAIKQGAVAARIDQPAIVMLPVQLYQRRRQFAQQGHANRLVIDESLRSAIRLHPALQDQRLTGFNVNFRLGQCGTDEIGQTGKFKAGGNAGLLFPRANQPGIRPVPQHQPQGIKQDRLARPGLPGQHAQTARKIEVERLDQDNIADG